MKNGRKLTVAGIEALKPPVAGRVEYLDAVVPQLALRVTANGTKSFVLRTRVRGVGKQVRVTLGEFPSTTLSEARDGAREALNAARRGINPNDEKRRTAREQEVRRLNDFGAVSELFIERYARRRGNKTWRETDRILRKYALPAWSNRPIFDIRKSDVVDLLDHVEDQHGIYMANRTLAAVRKLFNWAMDERGLIESTPIGRGMARAGETPRTRHHTDDEIRAIWWAADTMRYPFGPLVKLLLITAQRLGEVASMRYSQIEGDLWTLPASATKAGREHAVPLSPLALHELTAIPRLDHHDLIFTTTGLTPVSGFSKAKTMIDTLSGVTAWRLHDIRATVATRMETDLMLAPYIIGSILNHDPKSYKGITAVYTRADAIETKRRALNAWATLLTRILELTP